jgi:hypothetical protein
VVDVRPRTFNGFASLFVQSIQLLINMNNSSLEGFIERHRVSNTTEGFTARSVAYSVANTYENGVFLIIVT